MLLLAFWSSQSASAEEITQAEQTEQATHTLSHTETKNNLLSFVLLSTAASGMTLALFSKNNEEY